MWLLLAALGVVLVGWVVLSAVPSGDPQPSPAPSVSATGAEEQQTLLIQVRNDADTGASNMVAGAGGTQPGVQLLVPSRLLVDVPASGQLTLGRSARLLGRSASQDALSDLLALRIDGTLSLGRLALAGMVDFVGGITVDVDRPVPGEGDGEDDVLVPAGESQRLDGTQAAAFALAWLPGEPETARLQRFSQVITQTLAGLPDDQLRVEQMLTSLGGSARTTASTGSVAEFLLRLRQSILAGEQQVQELPTMSGRPGSGLAQVRADLPGAQATLLALLPDALLDRAEATPRVQVSNGAGSAGLAAAAREPIVRQGLVYINAGNAAELGLRQTAVAVDDDTTEARDLGEQVAEALGVAAEVTVDPAQVVDVAVVLGRDFEP